MENNGRILVPLDGSACAESILPKVETLAKELHEGICLVRVAYTYTFFDMYATEAEVAVVREAEDYLARIENRLKNKGFNVDSHVRYGDQVGEILDQADQKDVDLIAMSTHGRSGIKRLLMGSVAERILHQSKKPVLIDRCAA